MDKIEFTKVTLIQIENRKILFVLEEGKDFWLTPGGRMESGESELDTLSRELKEELSVELDVSSVSHLTTIISEIFDDPGKMFALVCYTGEFNGKPIPNNEIVQMRYMTSDDVELMGHAGRKLVHYLKEKDLID